jgi:hypothetical protein
LLHFHTSRAGHLDVSSVASVSYHSPPDARAELSYRLILDGHTLSVGTTQLMGGDVTPIPTQALAPVDGAEHTIEWQAKATYASNDPGDVIISPVSIVAVFLP